MQQKPATRPRALTVAFAAMAVGVCAQAAQALSGFGGSTGEAVFGQWGSQAVEVLAVGCAAWGARRRRDDRLAWSLIAAGIAAWCAGDLVWAIWLEGMANPPYPSAADAFYVLQYPLLATGVLLMLRRQFRRTSASVWLDGAVAGLTLAAFGAALIYPALESMGGGAAEVTLNLTYLLCDLLLLALVIIPFALSGVHPGRAWMLLGAGVAMLATVDLVFLYQESQGTYSAGGLLDTFWPASMALIALAAWAGVDVHMRARDGESQTVLLPTFFGVAALGLLVYATQTQVSTLSVVLATAAMSVAGVRATITYVQNLRLLGRETEQALTDSLTGLGNRRRLLEDLERILGVARDEPATLAFFDLNGFKHYNDSFGHVAGDSLLRRLGRALAASVEGAGAAYRLGGDEFCVLLEGIHPRGDRAISRTQAALTEHGSGFRVTAACGVVLLPADAEEMSAALTLADRRMYAHKGRGGRGSLAQVQDVLMSVLSEREPELASQVCEVGELAVAAARHGFGIVGEELEEVRRAAELHDLGMLAIPEAILHKAGPLNDSEWAFIRQHTIIGERILNVAPALAAVAAYVRSSHERWDGDGYPDRLAGEQIPLPARIIAVCDAYHAMISERPYHEPRSPAEAIEELRRNAGTQFDPRVVEVVCDVLEGAAVASPQDAHADGWDGRIDARRLAGEVWPAGAALPGEEAGGHSGTLA